VRTQTAIDSWLAQKTGQRFSGDAVDCIVEQKLGRRLDRVPVDPVRLAEFFGCSVRFEGVPAACIEISKRERIIRIPQNDNPVKQRFSVAHELAHLFFIVEDEEGVRSVFVENSSAGNSSGGHRTKERLETICDAIARQILVPTSKVSEYTKARPILNLDFLFELAAKFEVTPDVVFVRLIETKSLPRYPGRILLRFGPNQFTGRDEKWRVAARVMPHSIPSGLFWPNRGTGLEDLGISIPAPHQIEDTARSLTFHFKVRAQQWDLNLETSRDEQPWALAYATLAKDEEALL